MNTETLPSAPTTRVGLFARAVAQVTGLSELALDRLHTSDMGSPRHFGYESGAQGGFFYTAEGLSRLVEILSAESHTVAAKCLAAALNQIRHPAPAPRAPAGCNVNGGWAAQWEAEHS